MVSRDSIQKYADAIVRRPQDPLWQSFDVACQTLTKYAVSFRCPGDDANKREAMEAIKFATAIRREARLALGLKP
jgi:hypothetical protein